MSNENNEPAVEPAAPDALQAFTDCPQWGTGGQFTYDPISKTRTRTSAAPESVGEQPAAAENTTPLKKERARA